MYILSFLTLISIIKWIYNFDIWYCWLHNWIVFVQIISSRTGSFRTFIEHKISHLLSLIFFPMIFQIWVFCFDVFFVFVIRTDFIVKVIIGYVVLFVLIINGSAKYLCIVATIYTQFLDDFSNSVNIFVSRFDFRKCWIGPQI